MIHKCLDSKRTVLSFSWKLVRFFFSGSSLRQVKAPQRPTERERILILWGSGTQRCRGPCRTSTRLMGPHVSTSSSSPLQSVVRLQPQIPLSPFGRNYRKKHYLVTGCFCPNLLCLPLSLTVILLISQGRLEAFITPSFLGPTRPLRNKGLIRCLSALAPARQSIPIRWLSLSRVLSLLCLLAASELTSSDRRSSP